MSSSRDASDTAGTFWPYSLELYGCPGLPELLIAAQDDCGADVNLLLWMCWLAATRAVSAEPADLQGADAAIAQLRAEVVMPLRDVRRALKRNTRWMARADLEAVRQKVKSSELDAERVVQLTLEGYAGSRWSSMGPAADGEAVDPERARGALGRSLANYASFLGCRLDPQLEERLSTSLCIPC
ncbi:MAG: TIGR02444 family protein [Pseudomonadota bacterium]